MASSAGHDRVGAGAHRPDAVEHLVPATPPQQEQDERIGVEGVGHQVAEGGGVLARIDVVGARARGAQVAGAGEQVDLDRGGVGHHTGIELAVEERGGVGGLGADGFEHRLPLVVAELADVEVDVVGVGFGPLDEAGDRTW